MSESLPQVRHARHNLPESRTIEIVANQGDGAGTVENWITNVGQLDVGTNEVADTAHRWPSDGGVVPMMVVEVEPAVKRSGSLAL